MRSLIFAAAVLAASAIAGTASASCGSPGSHQDMTGAVLTGIAKWDDGEEYDMTFELRSDCSATMAYNGQTYRVGHYWSQADGMVIISVTEGYAIYLGKAEGREVKGSMSNKPGQVGDFTFSIQR